MPCKKRDEVHELIDWTRLEKLLSGVPANRTGEKAWPPSMMFKALFKWSGLRGAISAGPVVPSSDWFWSFWIGGRPEHAL